MSPDGLGTTRMILYAAARVLGCGSVQLTMLDEETRSLVFVTSIWNRDLPRLAKVESEMGFALEGARLPLSAESSIIVKSYLDERLYISEDVAELAGGEIPVETLEAIRQTIGPRSFAAAPVLSRRGILGVLLFEKSGERFTADERDLLVAYADRVGADLEAQALQDDVRRLETLEPSAIKPPMLFSCSSALRVLSGRGAGRMLWEALEVPEGPVKDALGLLNEQPATVAVRAGARQLRLTLTRAPGDLVIAAAEDMTGREQLRREAARAKEHLAQVLRSVDDVILTLDATGRVASANEVVERVFGWTADEMRGLEAYQLCADQRSRKRAHDMRFRLRSSGFAEGQMRLYRKSGGSFAAEVSALLLADDEERPAGVLWRVHDLTERQRADAEQKRLRARLLHTERLSALGEMAARIAHEVRNPLVSIGAAAQVVAEELGPDSNLTGEVQAIVREVRRLDGIVTDFLRFARPHKVERKPADLEPVVTESVALVRAKAPAHTIEVTLDAPLVARCDPDAIKQVLLNVLLNAVEASPAGAVECEARRLGDQVHLSVADRGPGVSPQHRARVFDPFFSTKTRGTGLGLAVSKQIVEEHKGRIRLLSRRGGGTRVVIELPIG